jgi:hypothetical protein
MFDATVKISHFISYFNVLVTSRFDEVATVDFEYTHTTGGK